MFDQIQEPKKSSAGLYLGAMAVILLAAIVMVWATQSADGPLKSETGISGGLGVMVLVVLALASLFVYFVPTMIASGRAHHNTAAIVMLNLFLGWTLLGWVAALVWAMTETRRERSG